MHCKCDGKRKNSESTQNLYWPLSFFICHFHISHNTHKQFCKSIVYISLGTIENPKRRRRQSVCKTVLCVGGQETHQQSVLWEMWKWRIHMPSCLGRIILCSAPGFSYNLSHLNYGRHLIPSTKLTSSSHKTFHFSYMKFLDEMFIKVKVSSIFKEKNNSG